MALVKFDDFEWEPLNLAEWEGAWDPDCQCEPGKWVEGRECSSGCEYDQWSNWLPDKNGQKCFPKYENGEKAGEWARWDWSSAGANQPKRFFFTYLFSVIEFILTVLYILDSKHRD